MRIKISTLIFALLTFGSTSTTVTAAEFNIKPSVYGGIRYDSNPRRLESDKDINDAQGMLFNISLPMDYRTPRSSVSLMPRAVRSFYRDEENADLEDEDYFLTGSAYRSYNRSSIGAGYGYTNLSLRTSQFVDGDPSLGPILTSDTQKRLYISPYWQYQFTQGTSLSLNTGYTDIYYDEELASRRFDYQNSNFGASLRHAFNRRHTLTFQANLTQFDSENEELRITNDRYYTVFKAFYCSGSYGTRCFAGAIE